MNIEEYRVTLNVGFTEHNRKNPVKIFKEVEAATDDDAKQKAMRRARGDGFVVFGVDKCDLIS